MTTSHRDNAIAFLRQMSKLTSVLKAFMRQKFKANNINITFEMFQVIRFLAEKESVNQQEIANAIVKDKASLTYLIDNLVERQLVQRTEDHQDRRNKIITLTPSGKALASKMQPWVEEMYELVGLSGSEEELEASLRLFRTIYSNLEEKGK